ncbi:MAG: hypothetical protein KKG76_11555 [Euryarchaeota archaeon]|nr:hypothetical protein [Euryarchaeota archaeon]
MQPHSILLPSAAIVLPSTTSSYVNSGDRFPLKGPLLLLLIAALGFYEERRWGLSAGRGRGKCSMEGGLTTYISL